MKRIVLRNLFLTFLLTLTLSCADKKERILTENLPKEITSYIVKHFPSNQVIQATKETEIFTKSYEVILEGNFKLEFNEENKIEEIESFSKLPESTIPEKIRQYVALNYPKNNITKWSLEGNKQDVKLNNTTELEFNLNGDFLRIDID